MLKRFGKGLITAGMMAPGAPHATIVVAASDASDKVKFTADPYVCDGAVDDEPLNAAQAALTGPLAAGNVFGGVVQLSEGTFVTSDKLTHFPQTTIRGMGIHATRIICADSSTHNIIEPYDTAAGYFWMLRDLSIYGNKANCPSGGKGIFSNSSNVKDYHILNCFIGYTKAAGIYIQDGWGFVLHNTIVEYCDNAGVWVNSGINAKISNCKVMSNTHGIIMKATGSTISASELMGNGAGKAAVRIDGSGTAGYGSQISVLGCRIRGNAGSDGVITVGAAGKEAVGNIVGYNRISGCATGALLDANSDWNQVSGNVFEDNTTNITNNGANNVITPNIEIP